MPLLKGEHISDMTITSAGVDDCWDIIGRFIATHRNTAQQSATNLLS